jgi:hypothetical protein
MICYRFLKWFDVDVLGFQIERCCNILAFLTWQLLGLFFNKIGNFFCYHLVTLNKIAIVSNEEILQENAFIGTDTLKCTCHYCKTFPLCQ